MHSTRRFHAKGAFQRLRRYFETRSLRYCAGLFAVLLGLVALAAPSPYCYTDEGELLLTTVNASGVPGYPVSNIVALIGWFDPDTVVMPNEAVVPIGQTAEEYAGESQQEMDQSQQEAVDAALTFLRDRGVDVSGVDVEMHVEGIGGPSAGMMYTLGLIDKLTPESETGGRTIAGTGTIDAEGNVGAIGGVRLKMLGAKRDGATWFLAPEANAAEVAGNVPEGLRDVNGRPECGRNRESARKDPVSSHRFAILCNVNQTASRHAEEFGFSRGDIIQEWLWDDDVDDSIRASIEELTGEDLVDEDYDSAVDGVIIWWRDGDDEDALSDTIVDAYAVLGEDGPLWVLTPKPGRPGAASSSTVQSAAKTAGMNAATPLTVSSDWNGIRLRAFGKGR